MGTAVRSLRIRWLSARPFRPASQAEYGHQQWPIEQGYKQAKGEAGLDQYQVRTWRAWYAHITLSMLALAWLAASKAQAEKGGSAPATPA